MAMSVVYSTFCGMVVSETRSGVESDYISDTLGSTIGLMDSAGTMTDRWEYWPFGEVVSRTGTNPTPLTFLGVIGYFQDVLSKLLYVRARNLRVDLARWLTFDPLWPRRSPYSYVGNSPSMRVDPSGLAPPCPGCSCPAESGDIAGTAGCCGNKPGKCFVCTYVKGTMGDPVVDYCTILHESLHCAQLASGACHSKCIPSSPGCGVVFGDEDCAECPAYLISLLCIMPRHPCSIPRSAMCNFAIDVCMTLQGCGNPFLDTCPKLTPSQLSFCTSIGATC